MGMKGSTGGGKIDMCSRNGENDSHGAGQRVERGSMQGGMALTVI